MAMFSRHVTHTNVPTWPSIRRTSSTERGSRAGKKPFPRLLSIMISRHGVDYKWMIMITSNLLKAITQN